MARPPKHDWSMLYLEYSQGNYKSVAEFAGLKEIYPDRMRKEFRRIESGAGQKQVKTSQNNESKQVKTEPSPESFPGQCEAIGHKSGQRCQHKAKPGERFCAQHLDGWPGQCTANSRQTKERCRKPAEPGQRVCKHHGGRMIPKPGEQRALKHGFFSKIFPDDEETWALVGEIMEKSPLDIIWENIIINYTAIARAQKTMFVTHKQEMIKELKKIKSQLDANPGYDRSDPESKPLAEVSREEEWEFQFAWDRQATFLKAQSEAMKTLEKLIARYEEMIQKGNGSEEHELRLAKLKQDMTIARERMDLEKSKVMGDPEETADDGFIDALSAKAGEAWDEYSEED